MSMNEPTLLATIKASRRNGTVISVYSDGSLAYQFPPNPKWIRSHLSVYKAANRRLGASQNLTAEQFIERHLAMGYTKIEQREQQADPHEAWMYLLKNRGGKAPAKFRMIWIGDACEYGNPVRV